MIIYPAIDMHQGRVVQMRQGDPAAQMIVSDDPVAIAQHWVSQGAEWLHLVNLDGAFGSTKIIQMGATSADDDALPTNLRALKEIRQRVNVLLQYGGGLRSMESMRLAFELGADRVVLGTIAVEKPNLVCEAVRKWGAERIVVGLDVRDGVVATNGWQTSSGVDAVDMGHRMYAMGVRKVLYTDISRDGTLTGVNAVAAARLGDSTGLHVIAGGGVADIQDIALLKQHEYYNIDGVVLGQSIYTNRLDLSQAIALGKEPLSRQSAGIIPYQKSGEELEILIIYNYALEQWQLPRGHIEPGETAAQCAQREFSEQTDLQLEKFHATPLIPLNFTRQFREYKIDYSISFFLGQVQNGNIKLGNENHCEALWVAPQEALTLLEEAGSEQVPTLKAALQTLALGTTG